MSEEKGWGSRTTGTLDDDRVVTIREGTGANEGQTLVGGGEQTGSQLDNAHDHYGPDVSKESDHGNLENAPSATEYTQSG